MWSIDCTPYADYILEFKQLGLIYKISDIETVEHQCNSCFFKEDNYTELHSYKLNGSLKVKSRFEIEKE